MLVFWAPWPTAFRTLQRPWVERPEDCREGGYGCDHRQGCQGHEFNTTALHLGLRWSGVQPRGNLVPVAFHLDAKTSAKKFFFFQLFWWKQKWELGTQNLPLCWKPVIVGKAWDLGDWEQIQAVSLRQVTFLSKSQLPQPSRNGCEDLVNNIKRLAQLCSVTGGL